MMCGPYECESEGRSFLTADEKVQKLEEYKDWLEKEAQGVEEAIARIRKK